MDRVLFVCGGNKLRSPTAEQVFATHPGLEVASAGINEDADVPVSPELLQWANIIFVMERAQRIKLSRRFKSHLKKQRIICLNIPDKYGYMDPKLIKRLKATVPRHLTAGANV